MAPSTKVYCEKCGYPIPGGEEECPACRDKANSPVNLATAKVKAASKDAYHAFLLFATNPVEGLPVAYESVAGARAIAVSLVFTVVASACIMVGYFGLPDDAAAYFHADAIKGFPGFMRALAFGGVAFLGMVVGSLAVRKIFKGSGAISSDCFTAGAALLPVGVLLLALGLFGAKTAINTGIVAVITTFCLCFTVTMLYAGCTQIAKLSTRVSSLAVPLLLVIGGVLVRVIYSVVFRS